MDDIYIVCEFRILYKLGTDWMNEWMDGNNIGEINEIACVPLKAPFSSCSSDICHTQLVVV